MVFECMNVTAPLSVRSLEVKLREIALFFYVQDVANAAQPRVALHVGYGYPLTDLAYIHRCGHQEAGDSCCSCVRESGVCVLCG